MHFFLLDGVFLLLPTQTNNTKEERSEGRKYTKQNWNEWKGKLFDSITDIPIQIPDGVKHSQTILITAVKV